MLSQQAEPRGTADAGRVAGFAGRAAHGIANQARVQAERGGSCAQQRSEQRAAGLQALLSDQLAHADAQQAGQQPGVQQLQAVVRSLVCFHKGCSRLDQRLEGAAAMGVAMRGVGGG